jgi:hypothetical protein
MLIDLREYSPGQRPPSSRQERKNATRVRLLAMGEGGVRAFARARAISLDGSHDVRELVGQCMAQYGMWGM